MNTPINRLGPPMLVIPDEIVDLLESTYQSKTPFTIEAPMDDDSIEFINLSKHYGKRTNRSVRVYWDDECNRFSIIMTDKRPYRKSTAKREN